MSLLPLFLRKFRGCVKPNSGINKPLTDGEIPYTINFAYRMFLSPVYFRYENDKFALVGTRCHKIVCGTFTIVSLFATFVIICYPNAILGMMGGRLLFSFFLTHVLVSQGMLFTVLWTLWCRPQRLEEVVMTDETLYRKSSGSAKFVNYCMAATILIYTIPLFYPTRVGMSYTTEVYFGCGIKHNYTVPGGNNWIPLWTAWTLVADKHCSSPTAKGVYFAGYLVIIHCQAFLGLTHAMSFACCSHLYRISNGLNCYIEEHPSNRYAIMNRYKLVRAHIGSVNQVISMLSFLDILELVLSISYQIFGFGWMQGIAIVATLGHVLQGCIKWWMAAETHSQMEVAEKHVVSSFPSVEGHTVAAIANWPGSSALTGWKFFNITYSTLGSVAVALVTYSIVTMQFEGPK